MGYLHTSDACEWHILDFNPARNRGRMYHFNLISISLQSPPPLDLISSAVTTLMQRKRTGLILGEKSQTIHFFARLRWDLFKTMHFEFLK